MSACTHLITSSRAELSPVHIPRYKKQREGGGPWREFVETGLLNTLTGKSLKSSLITFL